MRKTTIPVAAILAVAPVVAQAQTVLGDGSIEVQSDWTKKSITDGKVETDAVLLLPGTYKLASTPTVTGYTPVYKVGDTVISGDKEFTVPARATVKIVIECTAIEGFTGDKGIDGTLSIKLTGIANFDYEKACADLSKTSAKLDKYYEERMGAFILELSDLQGILNDLNKNDYTAYKTALGEATSITEVINGKIADIQARADKKQAEEAIKNVQKVYKEKYEPAMDAAKKEVAAYDYKKEEFVAKLKDLEYSLDAYNKLSQDDKIANEKKVLDDLEDLYRKIEPVDKSGKIHQLLDEGEKAQLAGAAADKAVYDAIVAAAGILNTNLTPVKEKVDGKGYDGTCGTFSYASIVQSIDEWVNGVKNGDSYKMYVSNDWDDEKITKKQAEIQKAIDDLNTDVDNAIANHTAYTAMQTAYKDADDAYTAAMKSLVEKLVKTPQGDFSQYLAGAQEKLAAQRLILNNQKKALDEAHKAGNATEKQDDVVKAIKGAQKEIDEIKGEQEQNVENWTAAYNTLQSTINGLTAAHQTVLDGDDYKAVADFVPVQKASQAVADAIKAEQDKLDAKEVAATEAVMTHVVDKATVEGTDGKGGKIGELEDAIELANAANAAKAEIDGILEGLKAPIAAGKAADTKGEQGFDITTQDDGAYDMLEKDRSDMVTIINKLYDDEKAGKVDQGSVAGKSEDVGKLKSNTEEKLGDIAELAKDAVDRYDELKVALDTNQKNLDKLTEATKDLNIYTNSISGEEADYYQNKIADIQKRITGDADKLAAAITKPADAPVNNFIDQYQGKVDDKPVKKNGVKANLDALTLDADVAKDIKALLDSYENDESDFLDDAAKKTATAVYNEAVIRVNNLQSNAKDPESDEFKDMLGKALDGVDGLRAEYAKINGDVEAIAKAVAGLAPTDNRATNLVNAASLSKIVGQIGKIEGAATTYGEHLKAALEAFAANTAAYNEVIADCEALTANLKGVVDNIENETVKGYYSKENDRIQGLIGALETAAGDSKTAETVVADRKDVPATDTAEAKDGFDTRIKNIQADIDALQKDANAANAMYTDIANLQKGLDNAKDAEDYKKLVAELGSDASIVGEADDIQTAINTLSADLKTAANAVKAKDNTDLATAKTKIGVDTGKLNGHVAELMAKWADHKKVMDARDELGKLINGDGETASAEDQIKQWGEGALVKKYQDAIATANAVYGKKHDFAENCNCSVDEFNAAKSNLEQCIAQAKCNFDNNADLLKEYEEVRELWNKTFGNVDELAKIATETVDDVKYDLDETKAAAIKRLQEQQTTLFEIANSIDKNYQSGKLYDATVKAEESAKIAVLTTQIKSIFDSFKAEYNAEVAALNLGLKNEVEAILAQGEKKYTDSVIEVQQLKSVKNPDWKATCTAKLETVNDDLYNFYGTIEEVREKLNEAYKEVEGVYDVRFDNTEYKENAEKALADLTSYVNKAYTELDGIAQDSYDAKVAEAQQAIDDAKAAAKAACGDDADLSGFTSVQNVLTKAAEDIEVAHKALVYDDIATAVDEGINETTLTAAQDVAAKKWFDGQVKALQTLYSTLRGKYGMNLDNQAFKPTNLKVRNKYQGLIKAEWERIEQEMTDKYAGFASVAGVKAYDANKQLNDVHKKLLAEAELVSDNVKHSRNMSNAYGKVKDPETELAYDAAKISAADAAALDLLIEECKADKEALHETLLDNSDVTTFADYAITDEDETTYKAACTALIDKIAAGKAKIADYEKAFAHANIENANTIAQAEIVILQDKYLQLYASSEIDEETKVAFRTEIDEVIATVDAYYTAEDQKLCDYVTSDVFESLNERLDVLIHSTEIAAAQSSLLGQISNLQAAVNDVDLSVVADMKYVDETTYAAYQDELLQALAALEAQVKEDGDKVYYYEAKRQAAIDEIAANLNAFDAEAAKATTNETVWNSFCEAWDVQLEKFIEEKEALLEACPDVASVDGNMDDFIDLFRGYKDEVEGVYNNVGLESYDTEFTAYVNVLNRIKDAAYDSQAKTDVNKKVSDLEKAYSKLCDVIDTYDKESVVDSEDVKDAKAVVAKAMKDLKDAINGVDDDDMAESKDKLMELADDVTTAIDELKKTAEKRQNDYLAAQSTPGDVDFTGKVDAIDYMYMQLWATNPKLQPDETSLAFKAADVNGDGKISVHDVVGVVNLWKGLNANGTVKTEVRSHMIDTANDAMSLENMGAGNFALNLKNAGEYVAFQLDVQLPDGMTLVNASLSDRAESHTINTITLADGTVRVLVSSASNALLKGKAGALVTFEVETDGSYAGGDIQVSAVFVDGAAKGTEMNAALAASDATGIAANGIVTRAAYKIYSAGGTLLQKLQKGVNVLVGEDGSSKKVVVK